MGNIQREERPVSFRLRTRKACRLVQRISIAQPIIPHRKKFCLIIRDSMEYAGKIIQFCLVIFHGVGGGLRPGPVCSALVWSVSDKTSPLSAPVHTALQSTEVQGADHSPREK